jgi:hypothetical protein
MQSVDHAFSAMTLFQAEILLCFFLPPFALAFLVGWFRRRKSGKPGWLKISLLSVETGVVIGTPLLILYVGSVLEHI